jgi:hypothetical protein
MIPDHAYGNARQLIDPDADYTVHIRTDNRWTQPTDPDHRELPGLDVLLAARRVLRARPVGHVQSTSPDTLDIRTGDGRLWLRFTDTTLSDPADEPSLDCQTLNEPCRVLGLSGSALVPLARCDLTTSDLVALARTCLTLSQAHSLLPRPSLPSNDGHLLERLADTTGALDSGLPNTPNIDEAFSRAELLLLADTALGLHQAYGDPDGLLSRTEVLLLAHLAYDAAST